MMYSPYLNMKRHAANLDMPRAFPTQYTASYLLNLKHNACTYSTMKQTQWGNNNKAVLRIIKKNRLRKQIVKGRIEDSEQVSSMIAAKEPEKRGSIAGAMSLIIGTSIGSGILAIPQKTSPAGFVPSATCIIICWFFLLTEALLLAEINVYLRKESKKDVHTTENDDNIEIISIRTMAQETLGELGGNIATITYLFLSYTSMIAYTLKSGEVVSHLIPVPDSLSGSIFVIIIGILISVGGTRMTDRVNQSLTFVMIGLLAAIEGISVSFGGGLSVPEMSNWDKVPQTIPVIIFTLVFHDIAPVICAYLGGDLKRIRLSIIFGSLVPLVSLLLWDDIALGLSPNLRESSLGIMVETFSILAVGTSLIGTLLGASQFFIEQITNLFPSKRSPVGTGISIVVPVTNILEKNKLSIFATVIVILPTMLVSTIVPDVFSLATDIAGGYCMMILYGALPPLMAWSMQFKSLNKDDDIFINNQNFEDNHKRIILFPGFRPVLVGMGLFSFIVVIEQLFTDVLTLNSYLLS